MQLAERPNDVDVQLDLLNCLKQAGQHGKSLLLSMRRGPNDVRCTAQPRRRHAGQCAGR
jgi:hypothetical protein